MCKNFSKFVSGGHSLFSLILAALLWTVQRSVWELYCWMSVCLNIWIF